MNNLKKPEVKYEGVAVLYRYFGGPIVANLDRVLGHPRLGNCEYVRTSRVLNVDGGVIETHNTIYIPVTATEVVYNEGLTLEDVVEQAKEFQN